MEKLSNLSSRERLKKEDTVQKALHVMVEYIIEMGINGPEEWNEDPDKQKERVVPVIIPKRVDNMLNIVGQICNEGDVSLWELESAIFSALVRIGMGAIFSDIKEMGVDKFVEKFSQKI
uniref:Uncharacterized protein n=1 Tax=viral metagenome TaxID=1070528 RepID=A0A6M3KE28_9ZZZZ